MGGAGGGKEDYVGAPIPTSARHGGTDADADGTSTESPVPSRGTAGSSQDAGVREAERQSIRSTVGAYSVVGPEPGRDETAPAGTVTRNEAFQRSSIASGTAGSAVGSAVHSGAGAGTGTALTSLDLQASHSIPENSTIATTGVGDPQQQQQRDGNINSSAAAASASSPSPHHPDIEYLAEARLVEEESDSVSRSRSQQSPPLAASDDDPPPPYPDGIAGSVISDITPAVLEAPVAVAPINADGNSSNNSNSNNNREVSQRATSSMPNDDVCVAESLKDSFVLPRRYMFVIGAGLLAVVLGLGLGLGLTRSSSPSSSASGAPPGSNADTLVAELENMDDGTVLTYSPDPICFSLLPLMTNVSSTCPDPAALPKGGPLNQIVADGILAAVREFDEGVDVSFINAGSLRGDINVGDVTAGTVRKDILPFGQDRAVIFSTTAAGIKATLEGAVQEDKQWLALSEEESIEQQKQFFPNVRPLVVQWPFEASYPYASGLRYDVDLTAPNGQRVINIEIKAPTTDADNLRGNSVVREWKMLDVADESTPIRVVASAFLEGGGDGYFPSSSSHIDQVILDVSVTDLFVLFASKQETLVGPSVEEMSTRNFVPVKGWA